MEKEKGETKGKSPSESVSVLKIIKEGLKEGFIAFWRGAVEGAKETPRGFFAPLIWLGKWLRGSRFNTQKEAANDGHNRDGPCGDRRSGDHLLP